METGYECKRCGYEPDQDELNHGSCPNCMDTDRASKPVEMKKIKSLPVGGTVDVVKDHIIHPTCRPGAENSLSTDPTRKTWWTYYTQARFRVVSHDADGNPVFQSVTGKVSHEARDCFEMEKRGSGVVRQISQYVYRAVPVGETEENLWTAEEVHSWFCWRRTYGSWLSIHDNIAWAEPVNPTDRTLARDRILEGVGQSPIV